MSWRHDLALLLGRLLLGGFELLAGYHAYLGMAGNVAWYGRLGIPFPAVAAPLACAFQVLTGALLIAGLWTRPTAVLVGLFWALDAVIVLGGLLNAGEQSHFLKNMAVAGGCLAYYAAGAGRFSLDGRKG